MSGNKRERIAPFFIGIFKSINFCTISIFTSYDKLKSKYKSSIYSIFAVLLLYSVTKKKGGIR